MARYIRLYNSPSAERPGNILGFSSSIATAAHDPALHDWLEGRGYAVTTESLHQVVALRVVGGFVLRTLEYHQAPGIPIPEDTVSASHLFVEPPLKQEDLEDLGLQLSLLGAVNDHGMRRHYFVDNRDTNPEPHSTHAGKIIACWS